MATETTQTVREFQQFIGGEWVDAAEGAAFDDLDPFTGDVVARVAAAGREDARRAVEAASNAFPAWWQAPPAQKQRVFLKAADLCAAEPARAARRLVDGNYTERYDYALQGLNEVQYDKWREYDAEDTIRFYALRLHEAGLIKSSPQKIIADGTDWRFLDELKRELKA